VHKEWFIEVVVFGFVVGGGKLLMKKLKHAEDISDEAVLVNIYR
jgi:hypothetical protein